MKPSTQSYVPLKEQTKTLRDFSRRNFDMQRTVICQMHCPASVLQLKKIKQNNTKRAIVALLITSHCFLKPITKKGFLGQ